MGNDKHANSGWLCGWFGIWVFVGAVTIASSAQHQYDRYDPELRYQNRGTYNEGLKPNPVSGYDIELLSAMVNYQERRSGWPPNLRIKFFLPTATSVFITVRQSRPKMTYYWLDRVVPPSPWSSRKFNEFRWSTEPVLKKVDQISMDDLGVVVRLGNQGPSKNETITPVAFFHSVAPRVANAYRFTFKTNGTAYVTCKIYHGSVVVYRRQEKQEHSNSPFTFIWDAKNHKEGEYRLVTSGRFYEGTPFTSEVRFYHRPSWK